MGLLVRRLAGMTQAAVMVVGTLAIGLGAHFETLGRRW